MCASNCRPRVSDSTYGQQFDLDPADSADPLSVVGYRVELCRCEYVCFRLPELSWRPDEQLIMHRK